MSAVFRVTFDHGTAFVEGPKAEARRRIHLCGDHSPIWTSRRNSWATSAIVGNRLLDQIEGRRPVVVEDTAQHGFDLSATEPANLGPAQGGLW